MQVQSNAVQSRLLTTSNDRFRKPGRDAGFSFLKMWKNLDMQIMSSPQIDIKNIHEALHSPDATYLMLDDGSRIAGRNLKQGWRLLAVETQDKLNYDVSIEDTNSKMSFRIERGAFNNFVTTRLQ
jgi:hypothetical protein